MNDKSVGAGGILIVGAALIAAVIWVPEQMRISDQADAATIRCQAASDTPICLAGIDKWAGDCYRKSFLSQSRHGALQAPPITPDSLQIYDYCLRNGPDSVLELRTKRGKLRREQEKRRREQLGNVPMPP